MPTDTEPIIEARAALSAIQRHRQAVAHVQDRIKVRRSLISRAVSTVVSDNALGINVVAPYDKSSLIVKTMIGEPAKAAQHYASRLGANTPDVQVVPLVSKGTLTATAERHAGEQERLDAQLLEDAGEPAARRVAAWAQTVGGVAYLLALPRDLGFGLPDRTYFDDMTDEEFERARAEGRVAPVKVKNPRTGQLVPAEPGDVWAARRAQVAQERKVNGRGLFTIKAYPRDMVLAPRDHDGVKWAAVVEEVPAEQFGPGTDMARMAAKHMGIEDAEKYGLIRDPQGRIVAGTTAGVAPGSTHTSNSWTLVRYFNRLEVIYFVSGSGSVEGATEIWRGRHRCRVMGEATVPVWEVPCFRTDSDLPGEEYSTPMEQVFAYTPLINQIETTLSNAASFNGIPRWVIEAKDGSVVRDPETLEPVGVDSSPTPGLDPKQAAQYPGTVRQLTIDTSSLQEMLNTYLAQLDAAMPAPAATGVAGASAPAWQVRQLIQQAQSTLREPVDNYSTAIKGILQAFHSWLRDLGEPIWYFGAPGHRANERSVRGLIEFDPEHLTDSIKVTQELDTPDERVILDQMGQDKYAKGLITLRQYLEEYAREQDAEEAERNLYIDRVVRHIVGGEPVPEGSLMAAVAEGARGRVMLMLAQRSPNFAIGLARQMAQAASTPAAPGGIGDPGAGGSMTDAAGIRAPGVGMAQTLEQQLGTNVPGGRVPVSA